MPAHTPPQPKAQPHVRKAEAAHSKGSHEAWWPRGTPTQARGRLRPGGFRRSPSSRPRLDLERSCSVKTATLADPQYRMVYKKQYVAPNAKCRRTATLADPSHASRRARARLAFVRARVRMTPCSSCWRTFVCATEYVHQPLPPRIVWVRRGGMGESDAAPPGRPRRSPAQKCC